MNNDADKVKSVFLAAIEKYPPGQWGVYLDEVCGGDGDLKARVELLLKAHQDLGSVHIRPTPDLTTTADRPPIESRGTTIGLYKILEPIGEGGMGVVYRAEQETPVRRTVALKIVKPGMDSDAVIARFEAERQALALMDHPNIAKVLDADTTENNRPFFVMELVQGVPVTDYCDRHRLSPRQRLELFIPVCQAVQHAHQKGIIHRDLKPSNVLVSVVDGKPVPKVIDFGVAKAVDQRLTERTLFTQFGAVVGTPEYMSPEQAGAAPDIDTRSDLYSLGVLLYELLTGTTPLDRETLRRAAFDEVLRRVKEEEPPKPSTRLSGSGDRLPSVAAQRDTEPARLTRLVRGDLDRMVMKAIEKDRARRYESADAFARDVRRYLDGDPVEAAPPSRAYRLRKFAAKHRAGLATAGAIALILLAATSVSTWQAWRATWAEGLARRRLAEVRQANAAANAALADARKAQATARAEGDKATAINRFLTEDLLTQAEPANNAAEDHVSLLEVLDRAADKVGDRFRDRPEVGDALRSTMALTYHGLASWEKAEWQWRALLESSRRRLGPDAAETLVALGGVGHILYHRGRLDDALALLKPAADGLERVLGPDQPDTLSCRNNLAVALYRAGRYDEAVGLLESTLKLVEARLGPDHPDTLGFRNNLGEFYNAAGRIPDAIALQESTLKLLESKEGAEHPHTLTNRMNLANSYLAAGRARDAATMLEGTLRSHESKLGADHDLTLINRNNLANAYDTLGRWDRSEPLRWDLVERWRRTPQSGNPALVDPLPRLGMNLIQQKKWSSAEPVLRECLKLREATQPDAWSTFNTRSQLGGALVGLSRFAEAEPLVVSGYEGMKAREAAIPAAGKARLSEAAERVVRLYEALNQPGKAALLLRKEDRGAMMPNGDDAFAR